MEHHDTGELFQFCLFDQKLAEVDLVADIEECRRLVEQKDPGFLRKGPGDRDSFLFPSTEFVHQARREALKVTASQGGVNNSAVVGSGEHPAALMRGASHGHDIPDRKPQGNRFVLGHYGYGAGEMSPVHAGHGLSEEERLAFVGTQRA